MSHLVTHALFPACPPSCPPWLLATAEAVANAGTMIHRSTRVKHFTKKENREGHHPLHPLHPRKTSARAWVLGKINLEPRKIREPGFGFAYFAWFAVITGPWTVSN
jgi:hypothetical protein